MGLRTALLSWQWSTYAANHTRRSTLLLHAIGVPLFCGGLLSAVARLASRHWVAGVLGLVVAAVGFGLQGFAHKREPVAPIPFDGPADAVSRIFVEQFFTYWRFVLTGGWSRAWRAASSAGG